jgi:acetylornithine deacetylase/succinyl-diaminopimelate desuccinylase-like protein
LNSLARVLAELKGRDGRVTIPGFYDDVSLPTADDIQRWDKGPHYEELLKRLSHSRALEGEADYSPIQRQWSRPTLDVHGLGGGFVSEGVKTVIPAVGMAKLSMRLVPDQDPDRIFRALQGYASELSTPGVDISVSRLGSTRPVRIGANHPAALVAMTAFEQTFGKRPRLICSGGSVPVAIDFAEALGAPIVASGLQDTDSPLHSPNEYYSLDHYHRGIEMLIRFMYGLPLAPVVA